MRFRYVEKIIEENADTLWEFVKAPLPTPNNGYLLIEKYSDLVTAINNIAALGFIKYELNELDEINGMLQKGTLQGSINMDLTNYKSFRKICEFVYRESAAISILINELIPEQKPDSMTIGLPNYEEYSQLPKFFAKINKINDLLFDEKNSSEVKIQNFDSGSLWIELAFNASASLVIFGGAVSLASNCFLKIQHHRIVKKEIDSAIEDSNQRQAIKATLTEKFISEIQSDTKLFLESNGEKPNSERVAAVSKAIELLGDLMDQGTTFQPAYNAIESVKEEFPTIERLLDLPTQVKNLKNQQSIPHDENSNLED